MSTYKLNYTGAEINTKLSKTITGTSNQITVANGDGISGNPTLSLPSIVYLGSSTKWGRDEDNLIDLSSDNNFVVRCNAVNYNLTTALPYLDGINQELTTTSGVQHTSLGIGKAPSYALDILRNVSSGTICKITKSIDTNDGTRQALLLDNVNDRDMGFAIANQGTIKWYFFNDAPTASNYDSFKINNASDTTLIEFKQNNNINLPQLTASKMLTLDLSKDIISTYDCDQSVATTSSPTFAGYTITGGVNFSGAITNLTIVNGQITAAS